jgi:transcription initiation factor TFIIIB Brf1 subunit/transcription initiation factor TFIIB
MNPVNLRRCKSSKEKSKTQMKEFVKEKVTEDKVCYIACNLIDELWTKQDGNFSSNDSIASAIIYIAYRKAQIPKNMEEIMKLCSIEKKKLFRRYKLIKNLLGMEYCETASQISPNCILEQKPEMFIERFGKEAELPDRVIKYALELCRIYQASFSSRNPSAMAGTYLYVAADAHKFYITQLKICRVINISEVTLRSNVRELMDLIILEEEKCKAR